MGTNTRLDHQGRKRCRVPGDLDRIPLREKPLGSWTAKDTINKKQAIKKICGVMKGKNSLAETAGLGRLVIDRRDAGKKRGKKVRCGNSCKIGEQGCKEKSHCSMEGSRK